MHIEASGATDIGRVRDHNEDFFLIDEDLGLYVVCDGMGGHAAGDVASRTAAERFRSYLTLFKEDLLGFEDSPSAREQLERLVKRAVVECSKAVYNAARADEGKAGMGTTMTACVIRDDVLVMGHVGDSRLYLHRDGKTHQLSEDHTFVAQLIRGGMPAEKAKKSGMSHVITRAVGLQPSVEVDTLSMELIDGDRLLLCSDGLVGHVDTPEELPQLIADGATPDEFIAFGNRKFGGDNLTALVVEAHRGDDPSPERAVRDLKVTQKINTVRDIWLFRRLNMREITLINTSMTELLAEPDTEVISQGETGSSLYIVLDGELSVLRDGTEVSRLKPGEHFGEMGLVSGKARTATVTATLKSHLLRMDREAFVELINAKPKLGNKLLWNIAETMIERLQPKSADD